MDEIEDSPHEKAIKHHLGEWLDCYILYGFDSKGSLVQLSREDTDIQSMALRQAMSDYFEVEVEDEGWLE